MSDGKPFNLLANKKRGFMSENMFIPKENALNQAVKEYQDLEKARTFQEYVDRMTNVIVLATYAIAQDKNNGDIHIFLAEAYREFAIKHIEETRKKGNENNNDLKNMYFKSIYFSASVIYHWKTSPMYNKDEGGEEVYRDVSRRLDEMNDFFTKTKQKTRSMSECHQEFYEKCISIGNK